MSEIAVTHSEVLYSGTDSPEFDNTHLSMAKDEIDSIEDDKHDPDADGDITLKEVESVLKNLLNHKCPGFNSQPYELYKYSSKDEARIVLRLLRRLFSEGKSPSQWHTDSIIQILLRSGDPTLTANTRA